MKCDKLRAQSRINIGLSFDRWRKLRQDLGLKSDADTAEFLLNSGADFSDEGVHDLAVISPKRTSLMELDASVVPHDPSVDIDENQFNDIRNSIHWHVQRQRYQAHFGHVARFQVTGQKKFIRQDSIKDVKSSWTGQETFAITSGIVANQLIPMMSSSNCGEVSCTM